MKGRWSLLVGRRRKRKSGVRPPLHAQGRGYLGVLLRNLNQYVRYTRAGEIKMGREMGACHVPPCPYTRAVKHAQTHPHTHTHTPTPTHTHTHTNAQKAARRFGAYHEVTDG